MKVICRIPFQVSNYQGYITTNVSLQCLTVQEENKLYIVNIRLSYFYSHLYWPINKIKKISLYKAVAKVIYRWFEAVSDGFWK